MFCSFCKLNCLLQSSSLHKLNPHISLLISVVCVEKLFSRVNPDGLVDMIWRKTNHSWVSSKVVCLEHYLICDSRHNDHRGNIEEINVVLSDLTGYWSFHNLILSSSSLLVLYLIKPLFWNSDILCILKLVKVNDIVMMPSLPSNRLNSLIKFLYQTQFWSKILSLNRSLGLTHFVRPIKNPSLPPFINLPFAVLKDLSQRNFDVPPILMESLLSHCNHSNLCVCSHNLNIINLISRLTDQHFRHRNCVL